MSYDGGVPEIVFAKAFRRLVDCPDATLATTGALTDVLTEYFGEHPAVRTYMLDDRGAVRKHVAIFVDDAMITDRTTLADPVDPTARIHVFQALSGG